MSDQIEREQIALEDAHNRRVQQDEDAGFLMGEDLATQSECDHDWEYFDEERFKQCTYPECQIERLMDADDYSRNDPTYEDDHR